MRLGIMQPYFFPYFEHFRLIDACDRWIVFDTVQYQRHSWMNRNRIANPTKEWSWLTVSVSPDHRGQPVSEVPLAHHVDWRTSIRNRLRVYASEAAFYDETMQIVEEVLDEPHDTLCDVNVKALQVVSGRLGIRTPIERLTSLDLDLPAEAGPGDWALLISRALGATEYRNPSGGRDLFDLAAFERSGIRLTFHEHGALSYDTGSFTFVPDLSVLDPLMWLGHRELRTKL